MAFGLKTLLFGNMMIARICLKDDPEGVVYHYEMGVGLAKNTWSAC